MKPFIKEESFCSFLDIKDIFLRVRKKLLWIFLVCFCCCFFYFLWNKTPCFVAVATFKDVPEKKERSLGDELRSMAVGGGAPRTPAFYIMKSYPVLKPLIEDFGLQIKENQSAFSQKCQDILDLLRLEKNIPISDKDPFLFRRVLYEEEKPFSFSLKFINAEEFIVFYSQKQKKNFLKQETIKARCNEPVYIENLRFTLCDVPSNLEIGKEYAFSVVPWRSTKGEIASKILIETKKGSNLLDISFQDRDRHLATSFLNSFMESYRHYLKQDSEEMASAQFGYLQQRKKELSQQFTDALNEYVAYLQENIGDKGFVTLEQEISNISQQHQGCLSQLLAVEKDIYTTMYCEKENFYVLDVSLAKELAERKQERDSFLLSLQSRERNLENSYLTATSEHKATKKRASTILASTKTEGAEISQNKENMEIQENDREENFEEKNALVVDVRLEEIKQIHKEKQELEQVVKEIEKENFIDKKMISPKFAEILTSWEEKLKKYKNQEPIASQEDWKLQKANYLSLVQKNIHLLAVEERMLQESEPSMALKVEGLDLTTAKGFFSEYQRKKDQLENTNCQLESALNQIKDENFEFSSLISLLTDSISNAMIQNAGQIGIKLKDEKNYNLREREQLKEDLKLQKTFFYYHVKEIVALNNIQKSWIEKKLYELEKIILDKTNQQISLLEERGKDELKQKLVLLEQDKKAIQKRLIDLREQMKDFPKKWKIEKEIDLNTGTQVKILDTITQMIEARTVGYYMFPIESRPLEKAFTPTAAEPPRLVFFSTIGAILGSVLSFFFFFFQSLVQGFPVSLRHLRKNEHKALGFLSSSEVSLHDSRFSQDFSYGSANESLRKPSLETEDSMHLLEEDLCTLRKAAALIDQTQVDQKQQGQLQLGKEDQQRHKKKIAALLTNTKGSYAKELATLLQKKGKKVLVIDCRFTQEEFPGLLQWLKKDISYIPIETRKNYDFLASGGKDRHGIDRIFSKEFIQLLEKIKIEKTEYDYDVVLLDIAESLASLDRESFSFADSMIITLNEEREEELEPWSGEHAGYIMEKTRFSQGTGYLNYVSKIIKGWRKEKQREKRAIID